MKTFAFAALCLLALPLAQAQTCEQYGVKGELSTDGKRIVSRKPIPLIDQARKYGGYERAAIYLDRNLQDVRVNQVIAPRIKLQVMNDLGQNIAQLRCWANVCSRDAKNPACAL